MGRPEPTRRLVAALLDAGITAPRVLEAFRTVHRERFVPPDEAERAEADEPIPIPLGQVTTQPSLVATMVEALRLVGDETVLEVGTGFGYQTAILATLAREVVSIERLEELSRVARRNLAEAGVTNVELRLGDGTLGAPDRAPFDAIITSAAAPEVPPPLLEQLADGGRIVHPLGPGGAETVVVLRRIGDEILHERRLIPAIFVPLVGRHGARS
jgi:protein-L-isoaspartate(D-aspartate) O-methyltransferase